MGGIEKKKRAGRLTANVFYITPTIAPALEASSERTSIASSIQSVQVMKVSERQEGSAHRS